MLDSNFGDGLMIAMKATIVLLCIFVPLGTWKAVEIAIWIFKNLSISFGS